MKKQKKIILILFIIASVICIIGTIMKINHVALANNILVISIVAEFAFIFLFIRYFVKAKSNGA
jgi:hypothetical protein